MKRRKWDDGHFMYGFFFPEVKNRARNRLS